MPAERNPIGVPLDADKRQAAAKYLQGFLVDLLAVSLNGKQAHWHVVGPNFSAIHEQLDAIVADARRFADEVAERSIQLGVPIDGRPGTVDKTSSPDEYPEGFVDDRKTVALVCDLLTKVIQRARSGLKDLEDNDLPTQDLAIEAILALEKHLWMLQAQLA